jgi:hypothetical protein
MTRAARTLDPTCLTQLMQFLRRWHKQMAILPACGCSRHLHVTVTHRIYNGTFKQLPFALLA